MDQVDTLMIEVRPEPGTRRPSPRGPARPARRRIAAPRPRIRRRAARRAGHAPTILTGRLMGFAGTRWPLVDYAGNPGDDPRLARSTVPLSDDQVGRDVLLMFEGSALSSPIIVGVLLVPGEPEPGGPAGSSDPEPKSSPAMAEVDGKRIVFTAENEVVLRCGEASITLTKAGKVLIKGAYLLSRSSGLNRIRGAAIQIN